MKTKDQVKAEILATLESAKNSVRELAAASPDAFVVVGGSDLTPFRTDGRQIRLVGERTYVADNFATAHQVAMNLMDAATINGTDMVCVSMKVALWAPKRLAAIDEMTSTINAA